jgi:4-amino-4-deoxy-L-arabinose transferase-like glycosyltransferase
MVSHPWLQFYVTALSFRIFGETAMAARLPFALAGFMTIVLGYVFVWQVTRNQWASFCAASLMVLSLQFLLYSRQCRNYSLHMFFTILVLLIFFGMNSWRRCALFTVAAILLFHSSPIGLLVIGTLGGLALLYRPFAGQRRWFFLAMPFVLIVTIPWVAFGHSAYSENTQLVSSVGEFFQRLGRYFIECASVAPLIGAAILGGICMLQSRKLRKKSSTSPPNRERDFFVLILSVIFSYALTVAVTQSSYNQWYL